MQLLKTAVKARIPLISIKTDDPLNIAQVLKEVVGEPVQAFPKVQVGTKSAYSVEGMKKGSVYLMTKPSIETIDFNKMYAACSKQECTIILVNPKAELPSFFSAGYVTCPPSLVEKYVAENFDEDEEGSAALVAAFAGLSYKVIVDLTLMAQAEYGNVSPRTVSKLRAMYFGSMRGLQQESTELSFYAPSADLQNWLDLNGVLFLKSQHFAITPRGLLLDGPPGTGKSTGAKHIANTLQVPLYRLDVASAMGKYVGESEDSLQRALAQVDACAPCVMLVDEIEKLFQGNTDSGTTTRLLSQMLWWLQEHRSRVLTIMTTNDKTKLPAELVRPGRIDRSYYLGPMTKEEALPFMQALAKKNAHIAKVADKDITALWSGLYDTSDTYSHADLTQRVMGLVKLGYVAHLQ